MNTKTKAEQIAVVQEAISKLDGTLMGDWLSESIGPAEAAIQSDYLPSLWVEGINGWVQSKVSASLAKREAFLTHRESALAKREADFEREERNFEHWQKEFRETVSKTHSNLEYLLDHL
tara:strand:+ start:737 stop:1093 length:357 start_codon:yes stop_codon:yes gene_type:complete